MWACVGSWGGGGRVRPGSPSLQKGEGRGGAHSGGRSRAGRGAGVGDGPEGARADGTPLLLLACRMDKVGDALEEVLSKALSQRTITVGVYEAAKLLNV